MIIRALENRDLKNFIGLCELHAEFEKTDFVTAEKLERFEIMLETTFDWKVLVVEINQELVGYCSVIKQFSTWDAGHYLYLDCLFLEEKYRGNGVGHRLMSEIKKIARDFGCKQIQWQTPNFNKNAIRFYEKLGAYSTSKKRFFWSV